MDDVYIVVINYTVAINIVLVGVVFFTIINLLLLVDVWLLCRRLLFTRPSWGPSLMILQIILYICLKFDIKFLTNNITYFVSTEFWIIGSVIGACWHLKFANRWLIKSINFLLIVILIVVHANFSIEIIKELVLIRAVGSSHVGRIVCIWLIHFWHVSQPIVK